MLENSDNLKNPIKNSLNSDASGDMFHRISLLPLSDDLKSKIERIAKQKAPKKNSLKEHQINLSGKIYLIQNLQNGKIYIGQTINSIKIRLKAHIREAKYTRSETPLNRAIRKYGSKSFLIYSIHEVINAPQWVLDNLEKYYIKLFLARLKSKGYNLAEGGYGGRHAEATIEKIRRANIKAKSHLKGIPLPLSTREKIIMGLKDHRHSPETIKKISEKHRGMKHSEETRQKLRMLNAGKNHPFYGKHHSSETKRKQSLSKLGEKNPFFEKHHHTTSKRLISEKNKGRPNSEQQKEKSAVTKKENFERKNPINKKQFMEDLIHHVSRKNLQIRHNLSKSGVYTWCDHLCGTRNLEKARTFLKSKKNGKIVIKRT